jgi:hypothetical protein
MVGFSVKCTHWAELLVQRSQECNEDLKFWHRMNDGACEEKNRNPDTVVRAEQVSVTSKSRLVACDRQSVHANPRPQVRTQEPGLQARRSQDCRPCIVECDCMPKELRLQAYHTPAFPLLSQVLKSLRRQSSHRNQSRASASKYSQQAGYYTDRAEQNARLR